jgi:hypothetical protein
MQRKANALIGRADINVNAMLHMPLLWPWAAE